MTLALLILAVFQPSPGQSQLFNQWLEAAGMSNTAKLPLQERMLALATPLTGRPYLEKTLEVPGPEHLVVRLEGFDCFTLVESVLALAHTLSQKQPNWDTFQSVLARIRYRSGVIEDYTSRLHYTSDWAFDNQRKGYLRDITQEIGGVPYLKTIDFMSSHRDAYAQLADDALYQKIGPIEAAINQRQHYYIPEDQLAGLEKGIQPGDILAITTQIGGLDISHVGLAEFKDGRLHMLHASSKHKRVVRTQQPLADYLLGNKLQSGIMVFRPQPQSGS